MIAIIAGATGLTGNHLLTLVLNEVTYTKVIALVRTRMPIEHPKLQQLVVNFNELDKHASEIKGDVVFCTLGTTKQKTPDPTQYRNIDYVYPLEIATIALKNGASQYHLMSSLGANEHSRIFYTRLKGELERDLKKLPYKSIYIYQPSLLVGNRKETRTGERAMVSIMNILNPLLIGGLKRYRSIHIETVAAAMLNQSLQDQKGAFTYPSDEIKELIS